MKLRERIGELMEKLPRKRGGEPELLENALWRMVLTLVVPMMLLLAIAFTSEVVYINKYNQVLNNVTKASEFNQNFKNDVDLMMYYYVIDSQYSEGLPTGLIEDAERLADSLSRTTTERESIRAISSVQNLCSTLQERVEQIAGCESYDERQELLENNVYVLTDLIQEYMYNYLYCEAVHLNDVQHSMKNRMYFFFMLLILLTATIIAVITAYARRLGTSIARPIRALSERVRAIGHGDLTVREPIRAEQTEIQTLSDGFETMVARLDQLMEKNRTEERQRRNAELALLQAQINPHFLYNTLDTIIWLIESGDYDRSVEMVGSLSGFFRHSLSKGMDVITIGGEEAHIRCYLEIQQVRYMDILDYDIDIPEEIKHCAIPKLTLQPVVENALYHGIKLKRRKGRISVRGRRDGDRVVITVSDDGAGMTPERLAQVREALRDDNSPAVGFGTRTVHQRLHLLFGEEYGITVESTEGEGTEVCVTLPYTDKEENANEA